MSTYPQRLAVCPVADVVLFPHAHLPLPGIEDRHRAVVDHALASGRRLVVAALRPGPELDDAGKPNVYGTACAGRIVGHGHLPDGNSELIVRGERVVRLRAFDEDEQGRVASLFVSPAEAPPVFQERGAEKLTELRNLIETCCPGAYEQLRPRLFRAPETDGGLELINTLAASFPVGIRRKLEWLAERDPSVRWEKVVETLRSICEDREHRDRAMGRYADLGSENSEHN